MGFNATELALIFGIALVLFGNRLPTVGKSLGEGIRNFKKGLGEDDNDPKPTPTPEAKPVPPAIATATPLPHLEQSQPTQTHATQPHYVDVDHQ